MIYICQVNFLQNSIANAVEVAQLGVCAMYRTTLCIRQGARFKYIRIVIAVVSLSRSLSRAVSHILNCLQSF